MGNTHTFHHRVPALSTAFLSTAALVLSTLSGTSCMFLKIEAQPNALLLAANDVQLTLDYADIGVLCDNGFYEAEGDQMWDLSRIFLLVGLGLGSMAAALAWAVSSFLPPTNTNWKLLSTLSSVTAVIQVPVFLMFEAQPCTQSPERQDCTLGLGSYFLVASTACWVGVTLATQCIDPPLWAIEMSAWRVQKRGTSRPLPSTDPESGQGPDEIVCIEPSTGSRKRWWQRQTTTKKQGVQQADTESVPEEEHESPENGGHSRRYDDSSLDSRLVLRVLPNGKRPGDDVQSSPSYDDLDSMVNLAEAGALSETPAQIAGHKSALKKKSSRTAEPKYIQPSKPSQANESFKIVSAEPQPEKTTVNKFPKQGGKKELRARARNSLFDKEIAKTPQTGPISANEILMDLAGTPVEKDDPTDLTEKDAPQGKFQSGIRALTRKVRRDVQRRSKRGYDRMDDDGSLEGPYSSPPIEVNIKLVEPQQLQHKVYTNDEEDLIEEWKALHATTSGVPTNDQIIIDNQTNDQEKSSVSYHSDPEPVYYSSDETKSELSLSSEDLNLYEEYENDDINSESSSTSSGSRGRLRNRRQHRRQASSLSSVRSSTSLMETTINEETDQDIIDESIDGETELTPYSFARSASAPEPRGRDFTRRATNCSTNSSPDRSLPSTFQDEPIENVNQPKCLIDAEDDSSIDIENDYLIDLDKSSETAHISLPDSVKKETPSLEAALINLDQTSETARIITPDSVNKTNPSLKTDEHIGELETVNSIFTDGIESKGGLQHGEDDQNSGSEDKHCEPITIKSGARILSNEFSVDGDLPRDDRGPKLIIADDASRHIPADDRHRRSMSLPRMDMTPSETDAESQSSSAHVRPISWKEQRAYEGGIHADAVISEDSSSQSSTGNLSLRARRARIRRLQRRAHPQANRQKERSPSPSPSEQHKCLIESLDLQLIQVRRPVGMEYGFDEASL